MASKETKKCLKIWLGRDIKSIEPWLRDLAGEGWGLEKTSLFTTVFTFTKEGSTLSEKKPTDLIDHIPPFFINTIARSIERRGQLGLLLSLMAIPFITIFFFTEPIWENSGTGLYISKLYDILAGGMIAQLGLTATRLTGTRRVSSIFRRTGSNSRKRRLKFYKFTPAYDSHLEQWLQEKAAKGLVLDKTGFYLYIFKETEHSNISYCCDYQKNPSKEYYSRAQKDGWTLVGPLFGWHIWYKGYEGEDKPEFLRDTQSIIKNLKKNFSHLLVLSGAFLINSINFFPYFKKPDSTTDYILSSAVFLLCLGIGIFHSQNALRIRKQLKKLKQKGSKEVKV